MATIGGALLLPPCVGPASITAVALSAVAMRANAEHGFASVAASRSKQDFWHPDDDKPPLRSGDDADGSLLNRRVIKKLHFLMRGDTIFCVTHFLPTEQETMQMAIGSTVTSHDRALAVNPVGIRNATPLPATGGKIGVGAREIKGVEFPIAHPKAVQVETSRVDVTAHDFAFRVDPEAEGVAGAWEINGHERSSAH